jgi:competence protein ComQ
MLSEIYTKVVKEEIEALLSPLSNSNSLADLVRESLSTGSPDLSENVAQSQKYRWSLLPILVCESISGHSEQAIPVTAALQLLKGAAELFDDIEDQDTPDSLPSRWGLPIATNVATTMVILAEKAITRLKTRGVSDDRIIKIMDITNSQYIIACTGQHLDLRLTPKMPVTEELYFDIIAKKSASQIECACSVGAMLATNNHETINNFSLFGHNLGMTVQITNDIKGIIEGRDIIKHKPTLPVIYGLAQSDGEILHYLTSVYSNDGTITPDLTRIRDILFSIGAIHYTTIQLEIYRLAAINNLEIAEKNGANIQQLKSFLE